MSGIESSDRQTMIIAVTSGKGGTGKTTVATSLALSLTPDQNKVLPDSNLPLFLDCDVEAPNAHLFLKPKFDQRHEAGILIPQVDENRCTYCGKCSEVCQYQAIVVLGKKTLVFPHLCHGCGSCTLLCPAEAISETLNVMGVLERGFTPSGVDFAHGVLNISEPMAVPVIRQLKRWAIPQPGQIVIIDTSPGTSCPVVEAIRDADFVLLITEPTPFGLHDLKLAVQVTHELNIPAGVVINRDQEDPSTDHKYPLVDDYCANQGLPVLLRIPFKRRIAAGIAQGKTLVDIHPEIIPLFQQLFIQIVAMTGRFYSLGNAQHGITHNDETIQGIRKV